MPAGEAGLDETADPSLLIVADLAAIDEVVGHLHRLGGALDSGGQGLKKIDVDGWSGDAADAFRARFDESPAQWFVGADAFGDAAAACEGFRHTVAWARGQATRAAELYRAGIETSASAVQDRNVAVDAHNARVAVANAGRGPAPAPLPAFTDPGVAMLERAALVLSDARRSRDSAGADAARAIRAAAGAAPEPPSLLRAAGAELSDELIDAKHLLSGVGEGAEDIVRTARALNPLDPWNVTHPAAFLDTVSSTAAGLVTANLHPAELVKGVTGTGWGTDPAHALGRLIPGAVVAVATGGAGKVAAGVAGRGVAAGRSLARPPAKTIESPDLGSRSMLGFQYHGEELGRSAAFPGSRVHYFDEAEREAHRLTVHDGRLLGADGSPFNSEAGGSVHSPDSRSIFVMDGKGNIFASNEHQPGRLHHSSFLAGGQVAGAGELRVVDGRLELISDQSGHYRPSAPMMDQVLRELNREGVDTGDVVLERFAR